MRVNSDPVTLDVRWCFAMGEMDMTKCIFCDILERKIPSSHVYNDDKCSAFMDIQPINSGHVLIVPNKHASCLAELEEDIGAHLFRVAQKIAHSLRKSELKCEGINLFLSDGKAAGQEIFHVHLHLFPRFSGDGFRLRFGAGYGKKLSHEELDKTAEKIRSVL
jgi:histidine triad (HIT) family protein